MVVKSHEFGRNDTGMLRPMWMMMEKQTNSCQWLFPPLIYAFTSELPGVSRSAEGIMERQWVLTLTLVTNPPLNRESSNYSLSL